MQGDFTQRSNPDFRAGHHMFDEFLQRGCPGGPTGQERMVGQHEAAADRAQPLEFLASDLRGPAWAFDQAAAGNLWQIAVLLPIVERLTMGGDFGGKAADETDNAALGRRQKHRP
jgi:hypothetical protein